MLVAHPSAEIRRVPAALAPRVAERFKNLPKDHRRNPPPTSYQDERRGK